MKELQIIDMNGQQTIDSRLVAQSLEVRHTDLLRKIEGYIDILENAKLRYQDFFIPDTYKIDGNNKTYKCYMLTKKGCEMVANKTTGEKGVIFTAMYVEAFNQFEKKHPLSQVEMMRIQLGMIDDHEERISNLENNMTITSSQQSTIRNIANETAIKVLGGKDSPAYEQISKKVFSALWRDYKNYFKIPSYRDTLKSDYDSAIKYLNNWRPDMNLSMEIEYKNAQIKLEE